MTLYFESGDRRHEYIRSYDELGGLFDTVVGDKQPFHLTGNEFACDVAYMGKKDYRIAACSIAEFSQGDHPIFRVLATRAVNRFRLLPPPDLHLMFIGVDLRNSSIPFKISSKRDLIPNFTEDMNKGQIDTCCRKLKGYTEGSRMSQLNLRDEPYRRSIQNILFECEEYKPIPPHVYLSLRRKPSL